MIPEDEPSKKLWKREDIKMELNKIPEMEKKLDRLEKEQIIINKRITRLQDQKEDGNGV